MHQVSAPRRLNRLKTASVVLCGVVWFALLAAGMGWMNRYDTTPGATGQAPLEWPTASQLRPVTGQATLLMFAHPKCPCTRASLDELAALMAENAGRVSAQVCFFKPENSSSDWEETALWKRAAAIPGVTVSADEEGKEAACFGGETSGDVLLYDARGKLAFHGGITAARGEAGENAGHATLTDLLAGNIPVKTTTPVFGCPLAGPACSRQSP